jgi:hypothetical protein
MIRTVGRGIGRQFNFLFILLAGYIFGRGLHSLAVTADNYLENWSHRDQFIAELKNPTLVTEEIVEEFHKEMKLAFGEVGLPDKLPLDEAPEFDPDEGFPSDQNDPKYTVVYDLVRSYLQIEGNARARTFQAIFAFYRSLWLAAAILLFIYVSYCLIRAIDILFNPSPIPVLVSYTPIINDSGIALQLLFPLSIILPGIVYVISRFGKVRHRKHFAEYAITDFIVMRRSGLYSSTKEDRFREPAN